MYFVGPTTNRLQSSLVYFRKHFFINESNDTDHVGTYLEWTQNLNQEVEVTIAASNGPLHSIKHYKLYVYPKSCHYGNNYEAITNMSMRYDWGFCSFLLLYYI